MPPPRVTPSSKPAAKKAAVPARLSLADIIADAKSSTGSETQFSTDDIIGYYVAGNGNVEFQVELPNGNIITFWSDSQDKVLEVSEDGTEFSLLPGVTITKDGGLVPPGSQKERKYTSLK